jgi:hypothetical protein
MDGFMKLSREAQAVIVGAVLLLILSFLTWQGVSFGPYSVGVNEWHGIGVFAVLLVIALLAWEVLRLFGAKFSIGSLSDGLVSAGLALLAALFTVITFLSHSDYRKWPEWIALILAIGIGIAAFMRARAEGVQMPEMPSSASGGGGGMSGGSTGGDTTPSGGDSGPSSDGAEE